MALLLWAVLAAAGALPSWGQARESYRDGVEAVEAGRYEEAEKQLRDAIAERGEEKVTPLRRDYLPYYYLGIALVGKGDCRGAVGAWDVSEQQGQIQKAGHDEYQDLQTRRAGCKTRLQELEAARTGAEQALAGARKAASLLVKLQQTEALAGVWKSGNPSFASRQRDAQAHLEETDRRIRDAAQGVDPVRLREARSQALQVAEEFDTIASDARERLGEISTAAANALGSLEALERQAHGELGSVTYLSPYPEELGRRVAALQRDLKQVTDRKASAGAVELNRLTSALRDSLAALRRAAKEPPQELKTAAEAFLAGDYEGTLAALSETEYPDARAAGYVCLLRAASRHSLYVSGGEADEELLAALQADVAACGALDPPPRIPSKYFSPRFVRFYEETLAAQAQEAGEAEPGDDGQETAGDDGQGTERR